MNFYQVILKKQTDDDILIFHEIVNEFWATALNLVKDRKLFSCLVKSTFDIFFVSEDAKSVSENICEKSREKAKERNKKKSKTDKKSTEAVDLFKQKCMFKKAVSNSRNHFNNSKLRNQIFKKQQYHICSDFHLYRKYYYLFSSLTHEDWILRAEIKKIMKKTLNENEDFAEKIRKL